MKIFLTGASGYIGGSIASGFLREGHKVRGLVRTPGAEEVVRSLGIEPVRGDLADAALLREEAISADAVINAASADHRAAVEALLAALESSGKTFLHTSGSSIVGQRDEGCFSDAVFDEETPLIPSPARAARVALNRDILKASQSGIRTIVIAPSLIYGAGLGGKRDSMQVPWLIDLARAQGRPRHIGPGTNVWSNVHIADLVALFLLAQDSAPAGAFYFAENGENTMGEICAAIGVAYGMREKPEAMTPEEAAAIWGEGPANDTMGSNSRVRARRARDELGWKPEAPPLLQEIEQGCYRPALNSLG